MNSLVLRNSSRIISLSEHCLFVDVYNVRVLCDHLLSQMHSARLCVFGGEIGGVTVPAFPASPMNLHFVIKLLASPGEMGRAGKCHGV